MFGDKPTYMAIGPTYRGYRRQALYVLWRVLMGDVAREHAFRPEHVEDLAVFGPEKTLIELVQVKDLNSPLALSDLSPNKQNGFFSRCRDSLHADAAKLKNITIATFGPIGPELRKAIDEDGQDRRKVAAKVASYDHVSLSDARQILDMMTVQQCREDDIKQEVSQWLGETVASINPGKAVDGLSFWIYTCSESSKEILREDLVAEIESLGNLLADMTAHRAEWLQTICPIGESDILPDQLDKLRSEYQEGVSARYEHIQAKFDVSRPGWMQRLREAFSRCNVVFLRGASGQGKTTLAYRYLSDFCPSVGRYEVKHVADSVHGLRIARALGPHARRLCFPVTAYLDVRPQFQGWLDLVKELSFYENIHVLVTIREEDWRRANVSGADFEWRDIELTLSEDEAQRIYGALTQLKPAGDFLSFQDAWARFEGNGPLLEFVYLVTHADSLRERLQAQIRDIESECRHRQRQEKELDLLRMVAVASAYGGRMKTATLLDELDFCKSGNPLYLIEKEYLVRTTGNGQYIEALHPIRARILAGLLCDPVRSNRIDTGRQCLPHLDDTRLENFLLGIFSDDEIPDTTPVLERLTTLDTPNWTVFGAVVRALLWEGVRQYVAENSDLIQRVESEERMPWIMALDFDIAGLLPKDNPLFRDILPQETWEKVLEIRAQQTPKEGVFLPLRNWLASRQFAPNTPDSLSDWQGFSDTVYWNNVLGSPLQIREWFEFRDVDRAVSKVALELLANVVAALHSVYGDEPDFKAWFSNHRKTLVDRFREKTLSIRVEDDGHDRVEAHFIVRLDLWPDPQSDEFRAKMADNPLHAEASYRVELLRRLLPDRQHYACKGYGHNVSAENLAIDPTEMTGVLKEDLHLPWGLWLNSTFRGLGELMLRPSTWTEYVEKVVHVRRVALEALKRLENSLNTYFEKKDCLQLVGDNFDLVAWNKSRECVDDFPSFPRTAVDSLGFVSESSETLKQGSLAACAKLSLDRYQPWRKAMSEYKLALSNFMNQAGHGLFAFSALGRAQTRRQRKEDLIRKLEAGGINMKLADSAALNLSNACGALPVFQSEFRNLFEGGADSGALTSFESEEETAFRTVWALWHRFSNEPKMVIKNASRVCSKRRERARNSFLKDSQRALARMDDGQELHFRIVTDGPRVEGMPALWIIADSPSSAISYECFENTFAALRSPARKQPDRGVLEHLLTSEFEQVVLVPCTKGRYLFPVGWCVRFYKLLQDEAFSCFDQMTSPLREELLKGVGLGAWDHSRLDIGKKFVKSFRDFASVAAHIRDIEKMGETDEVGFAMLQEYANELNTEHLHYFQDALDAATAMREEYNSLSSEESEFRPDLRECVAVLTEWFELSKPPKESVDGTFSITFSEIAEWSPRLLEAVGYAAAAYMFWADDVIEYEFACDDA